MAAGISVRLNQCIIKKNQIVVIWILIVFFSVSHASAADRPNAGILLETTKDSLKVTSPKEAPALTVEKANKQLISASPDIKIMVKGFRIEGNTLFPGKELLPLVTNTIGKELTLAELEGAINIITEFYRARGYLWARAFIPAQEFMSGIVTITIIEGKVGQIEIKPDKSGRISSSAHRIIGRFVKEGEIIKEEKLDKGLLLLNDIPGIEVRSTIRPGAVVGTADLILEVKDKFPLSGSIDADNYGDRYTGYYRVGFTATENNLANAGESVSLRGITAESLLYGRASALVPVGWWGTRLGAAYSVMDYKLGDDFKDLGAHGSASIVSAYLLHPFVRSRYFNMYGHIEYDFKALEDCLDLFDIKTNKDIEVYTLAFYFDALDGFFGGGYTTLTLSGYAGTLNIKSDFARVIDNAFFKTNGQFAKGTLYLSRLQRLYGNLAFYASFRGQLASHNLDSAEKFYLGGPAGVRSYPQGEASGDEGCILTGEFRYTLSDAPGSKKIPGDLQFIFFTDAGYSRINDDAWTSFVSDSSNLYGIGVGVNWTTRHFTFRTSYGLKIGPEQETSDAKREGRFWLQVMGHF